MPKSRHRKKGLKGSGGLERASAVVMMRSAAQLPLRACLISEDWSEKRYASVLLARGHPDGRVAFASFMVDLGCLGIKWAVAKPALSESEYQQVLGRLGAEQNLVECAPAFAAKLTAGAFEYARRLGFKADRDYFAAKELFGSTIEGDSASEPEIEYGLDGKPFFVAGPYDDADAIMNHLTKKVGADGFIFIVPAFAGDDPDDPDDFG